MSAAIFDNAAMFLEELLRRSNRYDRPVVTVISVIWAPAEHPAAAGIHMTFWIAMEPSRKRVSAEEFTVVTGMSPSAIESPNGMD